MNYYVPVCLCHYVYDNGRVYATHGNANLDTNVMGRLVCLDARTGKELWRIDGLTDHYSTPGRKNKGLVVIRLRRIRRSDEMPLRAHPSARGCCVWSRGRPCRG